MEDAKKCSQISIDTENCGGLDVLSPLSRLLLVQLEVGGRAYVIDARKVDVSPLAEVLYNSRIRKVGQNLLYDYKMLLVKRRITLRNLFDTMLAESILTAGLDSGGNALDDLALKYLNITLDKTLQAGFSDHPYDAPFSDEQLLYAARDTLILPTICDIQEHKLMEYRLLTTARLEFDVLPAVAEMEIMGMRLDASRWIPTLEKVRGKLWKVEVGLRSALPDPPPPPVKPPRIKKDGTPFKNTAAPKEPPVLNLGSWQQLSKSCSDIGIDLDAANRITKKGITNNATINMAIQMYTKEPTKTKVLKDLLDWRALDHLVNSFGEGLLAHIKEDGRIHASFLQDGTQAGRFSCQKPNLEQIQKKREEGKILRSCFIPAPGSKYIIADYSQLHLRIAAELSKDPILLQIFSDPDADLHRSTAAQMFEIAVSAVTSKQRSIAKVINFAIIYGAGAKTLASQIGDLTPGHPCTVDEAQAFMDKYTARFAVLMKWLKDAGEKAFKDSEARTILGRVRWFPRIPITDPDYKRQKSYYQRVGGNHPILGTDGDMLKTAMIKLHDALPILGGHLVNIIHDETVIEVPEERAIDGARLLKKCMIEAGQRFMSKDKDGKYFVPILVDVKIRDSWWKDDGASDNEFGQQLWLSQDIQLMGK